MGPRPPICQNQPLEHLIAPAQILGQELARLFRRDRAGRRPISNTETGAPPRPADQIPDGGHPVVGGDLEEVGLELVAGGEFTGVDG